MDSNLNDKPWYLECIDRCAKCWAKGILISLQGKYFIKCRCGNFAKSSDNRSIAFINWNVKQRKIRGKI